MKSYTPTVPATDEVSREFQRIREAAYRAEPYFLPVQLTAAPAKLIDGMCVWADGSSWNPGSGAGMYQLRSGVWNFLG